ncbi:MAG: SurA N-terminal domain-containing protein, partial [Burkholderiales bacterium]
MSGSCMQLRTLLSCVLLAALLPGGAAYGQQTAKPRSIITVDRIVAVVNDEVITQQELTARVDFAFRQLRQQGTPPPPRDVIERQLIERLINDRVQMQHARTIG